MNSRSIAVLAVAILVLAACEFQMRRPAAIYELADAGIVESVDEVEGGGLRISLSRGESIDVGVNGYATSLEGGRPEPGDLLLIATFGSTTGYASMSVASDFTLCRSLTPGSFYLLEQSAVDDGTHILFRSGLRLPKSEGFDPGHVESGQFESFQTGFALNTAGEVIAYCGFERVSLRASTAMGRTGEYDSTVPHS